jgi:hypothetical protein
MKSREVLDVNRLENVGYMALRNNKITPLPLYSLHGRLRWDKHLPSACETKETHSIMCTDLLDSAHLKSLY